LGVRSAKGAYHYIRLCCPEGVGRQVRNSSYQELAAFGNDDVPRRLVFPRSDLWRRKRNAKLSRATQLRRSNSLSTGRPNSTLCVAGCLRTTSTWNLRKLPAQSDCCARPQCVGH